MTRTLAQAQDSTSTPIASMPTPTPEARVWRAQRGTYAIDVPAYGERIGMSELARLADRLGSYWFDRDTLRFFRSRYEYDSPIPTPQGWIFVSSEQRAGAARRYSVRIATYGEPNTDGTREGFSVDTIGEFGEYATLGRARTAARRAAAERGGSAR